MTPPSPPPQEFPIFLNKEFSTPSNKTNGFALQKIKKTTIFTLQRYKKQ